ncbi:hypothetical protein SD77_1290 [Bacillus badius]|uniref:Ribose 5-phosphate isomerase B n=1 Tax=Bacillus badius TaxID=1455 RepID=A0ABR5AS89_BACBA|nr:hypothetical protein SD77_1290 [Bacillus badius]
MIRSSCFNGANCTPVFLPSSLHHRSHHTITTKDRLVKKRSCKEHLQPSAGHRFLHFTTQMILWYKLI